MQQIFECVPNFSEGRDPERIDAIAGPFRGRQGVKLLDTQRDEDHNRLVVTVVGEPEALKSAVLEAMAAAVAVIDLRQHRGQHPRMGAVDVVPFIPVRNATMAEAVELSRQVAAAAAERLHLPIFLYEESASAPHRRNLAEIRKGQFEGMAQKLQQPGWTPDFGPNAVHPTAGVTAIGARMPLIAFNVNLGTSNLEIANDIARKLRHLSGGLRYCKAIGIALTERDIVQVSMNMTDFTRTALYRAFELVRIEARRWGVPVVGSEIVGLVPMAALVDAAAYYLQLENFAPEQVLESRIYE
ncbi:MAG: glutamate formimidoyltransferase [Desulfobacterales bacterium]|jgi:glutamate formiminotransferase|nr:glutamate formimidoyltransferase [Desulfobacterales bacterium]